MSKTLNTLLKAHLAGEETTIATCWKLTTRANVVYGFTNLDTDISYGGVTYAAASGYGATNTSTDLDLSGDDLEVFGLLDNNSITEAALFNGEFDGAIVEMFLVNYNNLLLGTVTLMKGEIGAITIKNGKFVAQIDSIVSYLDQVIREVYSYNCRVRVLGDSRCGVSLGAFTNTGSVTSVTSNGVFGTNLVEADGYYNYGMITWTSGNNNTFSQDIKSYSSGNMYLFADMPQDVEIGDTFSAIAGCDRTPDSCQNKFNNFINYRGEPFLKGIDKLYSYHPENPFGIKD